MAVPSKKDHHIPKYVISLTHFVNRSMIQLEALTLYGDTCLNSTVSALIHKHGFEFNKHMEPHISQAGGRVYFTRYSLADDSMERAKQLINIHQANCSD